MDFFKQEFLGNTYLSYLITITILLIGIFFNLFFSKLLPRLFYKIFSKYFKETSFEDFLEHVRKPFKNIVLLIVVYFAFNQLSFPAHWNLAPIEKFGLRQILSKSYQILLIISVSKIFLRLADFIGLVLIHRAAKTESKTDDMLVPFIKDTIKVNVFIITILVILSSVFNLNISSIIAGLGIGGLAFALAAKETLENLLGSFTIFLDKPFGLGDYIQFGNTFGTVDKIGFRSTRIITDEKSIITVPNKKLVDTELNNLSLRPARRIKMNFTLVYETSIETVQTIIKQLEEHFKKHPWVTDDYKVRVFEFSDLGITILVDYFIIKIDYDSSLISRQETNLVIKQLVETNNAKFAVRKML